MRTIVLGPPGTGKTETLLTKVEDYLKETDPDKIGYFAFTQKAAYEARDRAIKKFNLTEDDLPYFRTLHSLAFRRLGLKKENVMQPFHYKDLGEKLKLPLSVPAWEQDEGNSFFTSNSEELSIIDKARHKEISVVQQYDLGEHTKEVSREKLVILDQEIKKYKKEYNLIDFHDMITEFIKSDKCPRFNAVFIDEAQDLSKVQWSMARNIWDNTDDSFVAGDDDQAIFRWAGADVEHFINMKGKKKVLEKSHRVPKIIHSYAMKLIQRIKNRNIKKYLPRNHKGDLQFHRSSELNVEKNDWLILATTNYILDKVEENLIRDGIFFKRKNKSSIGKSTIGAIKNWENLRKGKKFTKKAIKKIYRLMKENVGVKEKHIELESMPNLNKFSMNDLIKNYGLLTKEPWGSALKKISLKNKTYLELAFRKGENISFPRVKISTIHGAKGTQCDNVVLFTDLSREADKQYYLNPDDQTRVMYVGVTRAKRSLHIITPQTERGFLI